ncbi:FAD-dependent monooxygenase [Mangrovibrevibacter kandeliae]|uniref:FAD-dependent monooxygenase n=1 Tax=Mangrovibrevibacter kandeliae TaxID=2968473 RepID=UPI0021174DA5|nr:FAD-dependent monooxygenase [Aurantimonas sp. CSK15Z-1]MCQ8782709.1 FAD-dependent monooxygenase [Aurantimonas sp. CSK15Z-1]
MRRDAAAPVVVVGAGIAGLGVSLALARRGLHVSLFERAPVLDEVGAGLQLSPNALRVLAELGLLAAASASAVEARAVTLRGWRSGRTIARVPVGGSDGTPYLSVHRADLQRSLVAAVLQEPRITLTLGTTLRGCRPVAAGHALAFETAGGEQTVEASVVVGADGVNSRLAASLGLAPPQDTGLTAWRMTVSAPSAGATGGIEAWLGASAHAVAYPIRAGQAINVVVLGHREAGTAGEPRAEALAKVEGWDPRLIGMLRGAGEVSRWPLLTVPPARRWHAAPGILLIGDAAHAMPPFAAQGAALALEDASVAAQLLAGSASAAQAFDRFESLRRPRVDRVRARVAFHRRIYHLPFPFSLGRDMALRLRSAERLGTDLAWLYDWHPPA